MKKVMDVMVLGVRYSVFTAKKGKDPMLDRCQGYILPELKKIVLDDSHKREHQEQVLRHELTHAFLYESGLDAESWGDNEEIVDWIALQVSKMSKAMSDACRKLKPLYEKAKVIVDGAEEASDADGS